MVLKREVLIDIVVQRGESESESDSWKRTLFLPSKMFWGTCFEVPKWWGGERRWSGWMDGSVGVHWNSVLFESGVLVGADVVMGDHSVESYM